MSTVRPLASDEYHRTLDFLVRVAEELASCGNILDSLGRVAECCSEGLDGYCAIEAVLDGAHVFAEAGSPVPGDTGGSPSILELKAGRGDFGRLLFLSRDSRAPTSSEMQALNLLALELSIALSGHATTLRERRIADRLQRALLPDQLPAIAEAQFFAAYRPANDEAGIGGDWYDAFLLPDGRIGIWLGEVAGDGIGAATIMGEVRQAVRTAALAASRPSDVLERVNGAVRLRDPISMVTAIFAFYDPRTSVFTYAAAGHPPPILALPGGFSQMLPLGGVPLGCTDRVGSADWTFTLPDAGILTLYTDGMTENERNLLEGELTLVRAVRAVVSEAGGDVAAAIQARVFGESPNRDDAAVLTLARRSQVPRYVFSATALAAQLARAILRRELSSLPYEDDKQFEVLVAAGEAVANAIEHAYAGAEPGLVHFDIARDGDALTITIEDFGRWRPFVKCDERGRGIEFMRALSESVQIRTQRDSTAVVLRIGASA